MQTVRSFQIIAIFCYLLDKIGYTTKVFDNWLLQCMNLLYALFYCGDNATYLVHDYWDNTRYKHCLQTKHVLHSETKFVYSLPKYN